MLWTVRTPLRSHRACGSTLGVCGVHGLVRDGAAWVTTTSARTKHHLSSLICCFFAGQLFAVSSCPAGRCRRAATDNRSTLSPGLLHVSPRVHSQSPTLVVSQGSPADYSAWRIYLVAGFPLRCCQRFSVPDVATQPCRSSYNWSTSGPSNPVLSY